jgi:cation:H+ antiporter
MTILFVLVGGVVSTGLLWLASNRLETCTFALSERYGLPDAVRGSLLMAVASSMPELATGLLALGVHADFELGMSAIVGSAIYNILVIPACSVYARGEALRTNKELVYREAQFYLIAVVSLMVVLSMAVIYYGPAPLVEDGRRIFQGTFSRGLALVPLFLYGVYLYIQFEEVRDALVENPPNLSINALQEWLALLMSIALILAGVDILLRVAIALGELLGTPTFLWGMTVVATATSLPDTFVSVKASAAGRIESSITNVLGSNVFDLLVAVPAAVLVAGATTINFTQVVPMMTFLVAATVVMLLLMRRRGELRKGEAAVMLVMYLGFGIWMASEAFGFTNLLGLR